jgi:hypothetical protein
VYFALSGYLGQTILLSLEGTRLDVKKLCKKFNTLGCASDVFGTGAFEALQVDDSCDGPVYWNAHFDLLGIEAGNFRSVGRFGLEGFHNVVVQRMACWGSGPCVSLIWSYLAFMLVLPQVKNLVCLQVIDGENLEWACTVSCEAGRRVILCKM